MQLLNLNVLENISSNICSGKSCNFGHSRRFFLVEDFSSKTKTKKSKGLQLLKQVYEELYAQLGDDFSTVELLQAAQTLIDVTNAEYAESSVDNDQHYAGYFSFSVDVMIGRSPWLVLDYEYGNDHLGDERFTMDFDAPNRIKRYYYIEPYVHRG